MAIDHFGGKARPAGTGPRQDIPAEALPLVLTCPVCHAVLLKREKESYPCASCEFVLQLNGGIWRALPADRLDFFARFIEDYEVIRQAEGRGSTDAGYYLALPFRDCSGQLDWQWKIRGISYRTLEAQVWPRLEKRYPQGMDVLDIGAGNCWFSYRVALRGHRCVAVDLLVNEWDGLAAARNYWAVLKQEFPRFQAEMDGLPFADGQFDLIVFNSSLHYSVNYPSTLNEALRCLRVPGHLLVIDSPIYKSEQSGWQMVQERHSQFQRRYGFPSNSLPSLEFLTYRRLDELARQLGLEWRIIRPWYGLNWALRPIHAKLKGKREPSKFHIVWGQRPSL